MCLAFFFAFALLAPAAAEAREEAGERARRSAEGVEREIRRGGAAEKAEAAAGSTKFSDVFGNLMVLQRAPARAAVYGLVAGPILDPSRVAVRVTVRDKRTAEVYNVSAAVMVAVGGGVTWKALLSPHDAGGTFDVEAACSGCASVAAAMLSDVTFGDVWYCSGQSNMWLPMRFAFEKNRTFEALETYQHIRLLQVPNIDVDDRDRDNWWVLPEGTTGQGGFAWRRGWERPSHDSVEMFGATCWFFAQELSNMARALGETPVPMGLIGSYWGGTMIEMWMRNETLSSCKNATGQPWEPAQMSRWDINAGALYNGMVRPFLNMSIKGALWYQGENNVFECAKPPRKDDAARLPGDPDACGTAVSQTGYACQLVNLIETWRREWSVEPGTTDPQFPFGVVSLAAGTSEGNPESMGAFRLAQTGGYGLLPNDGLPNTFIAQAYDAGEPWDGPQAKCALPSDASSPWPCAPGHIGAPFTPMFMGSIHPRPKQIVGYRLASAARALVYGDEERLWTGPVFRGCKVVELARPPFSVQSWIDVDFDAKLLLDDAVLAFHGSPWANALAADDGSAYYAEGTYSSPMEVQLDGATWVSVNVLATSDREHLDPGELITGQSKLPPGYNMISVAAPKNKTAKITGIRYAWRESPCCPRAGNNYIPCPPNSCPLGTINSTLPAVPFYATIVDGQCVRPGAGPGGSAEQAQPASFFV